jgi:hypothetical protein
VSFVGRKAELQVLTRLWDEVRGGQGPRVAVVVSEPGYGKTELVKEFYRHLSRRFQGLSSAKRPYWPLDWAIHSSASPPVLNVFTSVRPDLNPPLPEVAPTSTAMPWVWWALDWPDCRGSAISSLPPEPALPRYLPLLRAHYGAVEQAKARKALALKWLKTALSFIPYVGQFFIATDLAFDARPITKALSDITPSAQDTHVASMQASRDEAMRLITSFLDSADCDSPTVPFVLVVDNCQWADPFALGLISSLLEKAARKCWPLLVLATHHEREWVHSEWRRPSSNGFALTLRQALATLPEHHRSGYVHEVRLGRLAECDQILEQYLPHVGAAASRFILDRTDGNPLHLAEYIRLIASEAERRSPWFIDGNPANGLSTHGLAELERKSSRFEDLIRLRVDQVVAESPETIHALKLATVQGCSFYDRLVTRIAEQLAVDCGLSQTVDAVQTGLAKAHSPHVILTRAAGDRSEFRHLLYFNEFSRLITADEQANFDKAFARALIAEVAASQSRRVPDDDTASLYAFVLTHLLRVCGDEIPPEATQAIRRVFSAMVDHASRGLNEPAGCTIMDLSYLTTISAAQARVLFSASISFCEGNWLRLDKLADLDAAAAAEIAALNRRCDGPFGITVFLPGLKTIRPEVLAELRSVGSLHLDGLAEFAPELASVLDDHGGEELVIGGISRLDENIAALLGRIRAQTLFLPDVSSVTPAALALLAPYDGSDDGRPYGPGDPLGEFVFESLDINEDALVDAVIELGYRGYNVYYRSCTCAGLAASGDYWTEKIAEWS